MPLPTYKQVLEDPKYQSADPARKRQINEAFWGAYDKENPGDEWGQSVRDDVVSAFETNDKLEAASPVERRALEHQKDLLNSRIKIQVAAKEGMFKSPEDYNSYVAKEQDRLETNAKSVRSFVDAARTSSDAGTKREMLAGLSGGAALKDIAGKSEGSIQATKDYLNDLFSVAGGASEALKENGGDIDKAIEWMKKKSSDTVAEDPTQLGADFGSLNRGIRGLRTETRYGAPAQQALGKIKSALDAAGIAPEERPTLIKDFASATAWTEDDKDVVRKLSTGELAINPGKAFGEKQKVIDEINKADTTQDFKDLALLKFDSMRKGMSGKIYQASAYNNQVFNGFGDTVNPLLEAGQSREDALDTWMGQQKDRWGPLKAGDAIAEGVREGLIGADKTLVGSAAGIASLWGGGKDLAGIQQGMASAGQRSAEAAKTRGLTGGYGLTTELANTVTQMAPMLMGGAYAQGLEGISRAAVGGLSVYGWSAAQGYESKLSDAVQLEQQKLGRELTSDEAVKVLGRPETQVAAFANGIQTAALSRILGGGVERVALGKAAASMTVRDFITKGGREALKDSTLRKELAQMGKTTLKDFSDEALEEGLNQTIDKALSIGVLGETMKIGDLLEESLKAAGLGGLVGGALPNILKNKNTHKQTTDELERTANSIQLENAAEENIPQEVLGAGNVTPPRPEDVAGLRAEYDDLAAKSIPPGTPRYRDQQRRLADIEEQLSAYEDQAQDEEAEAQVPLREVPTGTETPANAVDTQGDAAGVGTTETEAEAAVAPIAETRAQVAERLRAEIDKKDAAEAKKAKVESLVDQHDYLVNALGLDPENSEVQWTSVDDLKARLTPDQRKAFAEWAIARSVKNLNSLNFTETPSPVSKTEAPAPEPAPTTTNEKESQGSESQDEKVLTEKAAGVTPEVAPVAAGISNDTTPQDLTAKWKDQGVALDLSTATASINEPGSIAGDIVIDRIRIPQEQQRRGIGSKVLADVKAFADLTGRGVEVVPVQLGDQTVADLEAFYTKNGFVPFDRGENRQQGFRYDPNAPKTSPAPTKGKPTGTLPEGQPTSGDVGKPAAPQKITREKVKQMAPQLSNEEVDVATALFGPILEDVEAELELEPAEEEMLFDENGQRRLFQSPTPETPKDPAIGRYIRDNPEPQESTVTAINDFADDLFGVVDYKKLSPTQLSILKMLREASRKYLEWFGKGDKRRAKVVVGSIGMNDLMGKLWKRVNRRAPGWRNMTGTEDVLKRAKVIAYEIVSSMSNSKSGVDWYSGKIQEMYETLSKVYPELREEGQDRFIFSTILAITSNGENVFNNMDNAVNLYDKVRKQGRMPNENDAEGVAVREATMIKAFAQVQKLIDSQGWEQVNKDFRTDTTYGVMKKKYKVNKNEEQNDQPVSNAYVLGPKIGAFWGNLNGNFKHIAMDLWFTRTMARLSGNFAVIPLKSLLKLRTKYKELLLYEDKDVPAEVKSELQHFVDSVPIGEGAIPNWTSIPEEIRAQIPVAYEWIRKTKNTYQNRKDPVTNSGYYKGTAAEVAAKNAHVLLDESNRAPEDKDHRLWMRRVVKAAQRHLKDNGIDMSLAEMQAVMWFYEKDLYTKFGATSSMGERADFAQAADNTLKKRRQEKSKETLGPRKSDEASGQLTLFQNPQGPKGQITFAASMAKAWIKLNKSGDISTFSHEVAHFMRQFILNPDNEQALAAARRRGITDQEFQSLAEWAGVKDGKWDVAAEEKFARAVEKYLREGKAPNSSLQPLFDKLSEWLKGIYTTIKGSEIDIEISPEVTAIFDKLFAGPKTAPKPTATPKTYTPPAPKKKQMSPSQVFSPKNAVTTAQLAKFGLADRVDPETRVSDEVIQDAMVRLRNKNEIVKLLADLEETGRIANDTELAMLMHEAIAAETDAVELYNDVTKGDTAARTPYQMARIRYEQILRLLQNQGTAAARALAFRRILVDRRMDVVKLKEAIRTAKAYGSKSDSLPALDEKENEAIDNFAEKHKEREAQYKKDKAAREAADAANLAAAVMGKAVEEVKPKTIKERVIVEGRKLLDEVKQSGASLFGRKLFQNAPKEQDEVVEVEGFHGTTKSFAKFDLARSGQNFAVGGASAAFFTSDGKLARAYADSVSKYRTSGKPRVVSAKLSLNKPLKISTTEDQSAVHFDKNKEAILRQKKEGGHGDIIIEGPNDTTFIVFDSSSIGKIQKTLYQQPSDPLSDLDPENVKILTKISKMLVATGNDTVEKFTTALTKELGEEAAPYATALFNKAQQKIKKAARSPKEVRDSIDPNKDISGTDVYNMVKGYLTLGVPEEEVLGRVHQDLQQVWPEISPDEVNDMFTGYGKVKFPSEEEIETKLRHLRRVTLIETQIGDMKRGKVPKKTGQQRDPKADDERALEKEAKNLYKTLDIPRESDAELKSPLESIKSRFKNEITDREAAIKSRKPLPDKTPPTAYDEETKNLKAELDEVRKRYDETFADPAATEAQQLERAIRALDRLIEKEEQMAADGILKNPPRTGIDPLTDAGYLARKIILDGLRKARVDAYLFLNPKKSRAEVLHDAALAAQKRGLARDRQIVATGRLVVRRVSPLAYTPNAELQAVLAERDALGDLIDEMKKNQREAATAARKPQRDAAKLTRDIANAAKSLDKLNRQIDALLTTGTLPTRTAKPGTTNPVLKAIRDSRKERVKVLAALERAAKQTKSPRELLEERRIKAIQKKEAELKAMLASGQYLKVKKTPEPLNAKEQAAKFALEQVERDFEKFRQEKMLENATAFEKAKRVVHGGYRFVRMWKLMGNFIGLLQGAQFTYRKLTSGQWVSLARAVKRSARAGFSDQQADAEYKTNVAELEALGFSEKDVRLLNPNETTTLRKEDLPDMDIFEKLSKADPSILNLGAPLVFASLRRMELINQSFLNQARVDTVKTMMGWANGRIPTEEERKNIGKIAEVVTGRGQVGKNLENAIPFLNDFMFNSLRWTVSQFQNALGYPVWKAPRGMRLKTLDQLYIRPKIGKVLLGTLTSMLMGAAGDDDDEEERKRRLKKWYDPRESSFGKVPLPRGGNLDIGQGEGATLHFVMNNLLGWEFQRGGEAVKLRDSWVWGDGGALKDAKVPFQGDLKDKDIDYLLNRMNVVSAAILRNTVWREKFGGGSPEVLDTMKDFFVPLIAEDTFNMFKLYGLRGAIIWLETLQGASFNEPRPKKEEKRASNDTILGSLFPTTPSKRKTDIFEPVSDKPKKRSAGDLFR